MTVARGADGGNELEGNEHHQWSGRVSLTKQRMAEEMEEEGEEEEEVDVDVVVDVVVVEEVEVQGVNV